MPPAARVSDPTAHGAPLAPGPGSPNVMIGGMPAWRAMIDQHACPAVSITGPDGMGMVMMGSPTVLINYQMACRSGDIVMEIPGLALGPVDPIVMGCPTVMIGEVGMGGAGSSLGAAAGVAKSSAIGVIGDLPSKLGKGVAGSPTPAPQAVMAPPANTSTTSPPAAPPPKETTQRDTEIVCGITVNSLTVSCQHGRKPKDALLEVVGSLGGGDTINASCGIIGSCGQHPLWEVGGYWETQKKGTKISFAARDFEAIPKGRLFAPVWLGDIAPHVYTVNVASCSGPTFAFQINAYPNDAQEIKFSADLFEEKFGPFRKHFKELLEQLVDHPVFDFLKGGGSCSLQWKEDEKSNRAFYAWQISLAFNPFLAIGARFPLGPQAALPAAIRKYVNAGFFVEVRGEITLSLEGGQLSPPWTQKGHFDAKAEANLQLTVGGSVFTGKSEEDAYIKIEAALQSSVGVEAIGEIEDQKPRAEFSAKASGLQGYVIFHTFWREKKTQWTIFGEQPIGDKIYWYPLGEGEGGSSE